mmetsp:Transcript_1428/g.2943  ORF Transcript_1428/g.2943 Transcript_1428/m.2943 type:complete len:297 (-) Transcript_1428:9-899(-)
MSARRCAPVSYSTPRARSSPSFRAGSFGSACPRPCSSRPPIPRSLAVCPVLQSRARVRALNASAPPRSTRAQSPPRAPTTPLPPATRQTSASTLPPVLATDFSAFQTVPVLHSHFYSTLLLLLPPPLFLLHVLCVFLCHLAASEHAFELVFPAFDEFWERACAAAVSARDDISSTALSTRERGSIHAHVGDAFTDRAQRLPRPTTHSAQLLLHRAQALRTQIELRARPGPTHANLRQEIVLEPGRLRLHRLPTSHANTPVSPRASNNRPKPTPAHETNTRALIHTASLLPPNRPKP